MIKSAIQKIQNKDNLSEKEITVVMETLMSGQAAENDIRDFLVALNKKGPTVQEITAAAKIMRRFCQPLENSHEVILDTCGTGGDNSNTFNISTVVALVVAACDVVVAKHGNRSVSSRCGSADILEGLGVNLEIEQTHVARCLDEIGIAFLFAPKFHPAMKHVANVRKALGVKTIFNILGPLTNPAGATHQMMGVYSRDLVEPLAFVLKDLGLKRALIVHGSDGLDEITTTGKTYVGEFNGDEVISYDLDPEEFGIQRATMSELRGGDLATNIQIIDYILAGKRSAARDIVVVNAAYALYTAQAVDRITDGIYRAHDALDSGLAKKKLKQLKDFTQNVG